MTIEEQVLKLPKARKIDLMETLWSDLTNGPAPFDPPAWHLDELEETERLLAAGKESFQGWEHEKHRLRDL